MNILRNFLSSTIPQFFKNTEVRREVCKIASVCGGGSGGAVSSVNSQTGDVVLDAADVNALPDTYTPPDQTLQQVTSGTGDNVTSNTLQLTGLDNYNAGTESMLLAYSGGEGIISKTNTIGNGTISLLGDGTIKILVGNSVSNTLSDILLLQDTTGSGDNIATFGARVKVQNATEDEDAVNLGQLNTTGEQLQEFIQTNAVLKNSIDFGESLFTADGTTTEFDITHSLGVTPVSFTLTTTTPITLNHLNRTVTFPNTTTMRITYTNAPTIGEDVNYVWRVYK